MSAPPATIPASASATAPPPLPETLVTVRRLNRVFDHVHAVRDISFDISRGQVVGFIGANGAGKTTTMRMMATLDVPNSGSIRIADMDVVQRPGSVRRLIGWMPDHYGTYAHMTVFEYLDFFARAYGFKREQRKTRVEEVMDFADLTVLADRPMNKLSKGMGQRLCFGRMLLPDPEFMILDEPAAGLDPKARLEFKNLVRILAQRGKTLFISSHILSELGEMCDTLLFIDAGKLVYHGSAESLRRNHGSSANGNAQTLLDIVLAGPGDMLAQWASMNPLWTLVEERRDGARLLVESCDPLVLAAGLKKMILDGLPVIEFHREERRLEDAFVDMLRKISVDGATRPM
jgi:ABC-2 type transport system ATP-binding protein